MITETINCLLDERLCLAGWTIQSNTFTDPTYITGRWNSNWRLDFAKNDISIEVAFNHGEAVAWKLIKPVLACELNHVEKSIQTRAGIIICATDEMKPAGATGSYEKFLQYLPPLNNIITISMVIIGLTAPATVHPSLS